jgi:hypothetical protein
MLVERSPLTLLISLNYIRWTLVYVILIDNFLRDRSGVQREGPPLWVRGKIQVFTIVAVFSGLKRFVAFGSLY